MKKRSVPHNDMYDAVLICHGAKRIKTQHDNGTGSAPGYAVPYLDYVNASPTIDHTGPSRMVTQAAQTEKDESAKRIEGLVHQVSFTSI